MNSEELIRKRPIIDKYGGLHCPDCGQTLHEKQDRCPICKQAIDKVEPPEMIREQEENLSKDNSLIGNIKSYFRIRSTEIIIIYIILVALLVVSVYSR